LRALIVAAPGVQDVELAYPFYRLHEAGYHVTVASESAGEFQGIQGVKFKAHASMRDAEDIRPDLLLVPGGVKAMEKLRLNASAIRIVSDHFHRNGVIASICSGAQLLISARIVKGRTISAYPAMRVDVENAGATWFPGVYADGNIVTAPHYDLLGSWMAVVLGVARDQMFRREGAACAAAL
jgi:protease I